MAYRRGEDTEDALVGALIEARQAHDIRRVTALLGGLGRRHG